MEFKSVEDVNTPENGEKKRCNPERKQGSGKISVPPGGKRRGCMEKTLCERSIKSTRKKNQVLTTTLAKWWEGKKTFA